MQHVQILVTPVANISITLLLAEMSAMDNFLQLLHGSSQ
jgi:hypothetical protein